MKKSTRILKRLLALSLVLLLSIESFAAVVGDNDGAAFITKAEFDSLKNTFQAEINRYNSSLDNKINGAISDYLAGVKYDKESKIENTLYKIWNSNRNMNWQYPTFGARSNRANLLINGGVSGYAAHELTKWRTFIINKTDNKYESGTDNLIWYYQEKDGKKYLIGRANDYIRTLMVLSGSAMLMGSGDSNLTFGRSTNLSGGSGTTPTYTRYNLSQSTSDVTNQQYLLSNSSGWSQQTIYYSLNKLYMGGTLTDYRLIQPAGAVNTTIYASDFDKRGTNNWEYWSTISVSQAFTPIASTCSHTMTLADDVPVFRFVSISFNVNSTYNYLANTVGEEIPYYGGLPLCKASYNGNCVFNLTVNAACYLSIKEDATFNNTTAQGDPGVRIKKNSESTDATYISLAANTKTKLTFPSKSGSQYYIKLTPTSTSGSVKITQLDNVVVNKEE